MNSREKKSFITMLKTLFDCVLVDQSSLNSKKKMFNSDCVLNDHFLIPIVPDYINIKHYYIKPANMHA